ncbi:unnamed protein product [Caenorhabditis sp. 36 PRJEB53466]|nr:unnamed protein product [Caenorhabditis sp. 36 PRJEB53466]
MNKLSIFILLIALVVGANAIPTTNLPCMSAVVRRVDQVCKGRKIEDRPSASPASRIMRSCCEYGCANEDLEKHFCSTNPKTIFDILKHLLELA